MVIKLCPCFYGLFVISDVIVASIDEVVDLFCGSTHNSVDLDVSD